MRLPLAARALTGASSSSGAVGGGCDRGSEGVERSRDGLVDACAACVVVHANSLGPLSSTGARLIRFSQSGHGKRGLVFGGPAVSCAWH